MHALQRTCLLALLLSTPAHSEAGLQNKTMSDEDGPLHEQHKATITVSAVSGQEAALECRTGSQTSLILQYWKIETLTAYNCLRSFRFDGNKLFTNCSERIKWTPTSAGPDTLYVKPVAIADEGQYTFGTVTHEGTFNCYITLHVQVSPVVTLTTDGSGALVCKASIGKPAANISWQPACEDCITETLPHHNKTVTVTSKYTARSENETIVCIVSHPTFPVPHNLSTAFSHLGPGARKSDTGAWNSPLVWLTVTLCCIIITAAIIGFIFYKKPQQLRQCYKFTCGQETSLQRDEQNAEVVEEVEPYASFTQKVNTIYCSITELAPEYMPDGSQVDIRNDLSRDWN